MVISSLTSTLPGTAMRPRSLRSRSISITCSARSFRLAIRRSRSRSSSARSRAWVPAIGRVWATPSATSISRSGEELSTVLPPQCVRARRTAPDSPAAAAHTALHGIDRLRVTRLPAPRQVGLEDIAGLQVVEHALDAGRGSAARRPRRVRLAAGLYGHRRTHQPTQRCPAASWASNASEDSLIAVTVPSRRSTMTAAVQRTASASGSAYGDAGRRKPRFSPARSFVAQQQKTSHPANGKSAGRRLRQLRRRMVRDVRRNRRRRRALRWRCPAPRTGRRSARPADGPHTDCSRNG